MSSGNPQSVQQRRSETTDVVGPVLAAATGILAVIVVAAHVALAAFGKLDATVTLLLNLLALTFTTICTIWVGRWSALRENKAFIRAALRTTYGLYEGLQASERSALEAAGRMKRRSALATDVFGDFWEEVLGRVLDHTRALMRRAQETVANWQEFGPEEVERLFDAESNKLRAVTEVSTVIDEMRGILRDFRDFPGVADAASLRARIAELEHERARISASSALAIPSTGEARKLLAAGAFEEAVSAYSSLIATSPDSHTLYIARARARYLAGDVAGALADLDLAVAKCANDPTIERLRTEIREGRTPVSSRVDPQPDWRAETTRGLYAVAAGDADRAVQHFRAARQAGLLPIFAATNEAMAELLANRPGAARELIAEALPGMTGPFVRIQGLALMAIADGIGGEDDTQSLAALRESLAALHQLGNDFDVSESPLQYLLTGLAQQGKFDKVAHIFSVLSPSDSGPSRMILPEAARPSLEQANSAEMVRAAQQGDAAVTKQPPSVK